MDEMRELYKLQEGKATFREYFIAATGKHRFEVKSQGKVLYDGESYQQAKALFEELGKN